MHFSTFFFFLLFFFSVGKRDPNASLWPKKRKIMTTFLRGKQKSCQYICYHLLIIYFCSSLLPNLYNFYTLFINIFYLYFFCSSSKRPERLISKLKAMNLEDAARSGRKIVVLRQPKVSFGFSNSFSVIKVIFSLKSKSYFPSIKRMLTF